MKNVILIMLVCLVACNLPTKSKSKTLDVTQHASQNTNKDSETLIVKRKCVVIYHPDSLKIDTYLKSDSNGFYVTSDDAMFYISQAREFLEKKKVEILETELRYIEFYRDNILIGNFDLSSDSKNWGIILYNGYDKPKELDLTYIEADFNEIINK